MISKIEELKNERLTKICNSELNNICELIAAEKESYAEYDTGNESLDYLLLRMTKNLNYYYSDINDRLPYPKAKKILADICRGIKAIFKTYKILKNEFSKLGITFDFTWSYQIRY
ncbi:MAG: hypothetical protein K2P14_06585, partial [Anaeroplasmataceae bacterium]|nr:hypothetical protein [Anaeroplasmataceae bacterium]